MIHGKKIICVIPARLQSTRFPKKILALLAGKPLIQWTWEAASKVSFFDEVVIAVDSEEVAKIVAAFGGKWVMTSSACQNGTERLAEVERTGLFQADVWVNWQADEPFLKTKIMADLLQSCGEEGEDLWTLKTELAEERAHDPSLCKVVTDCYGFALYFSRSLIPFRRDKVVGKVFRHIGLYAYSRAALAKIATLTPCDLEQSEMLEQLRFLFHGLKIRVHETKEDSLGIDLPEHLILAEHHVKQLSFA